MPPLIEGLPRAVLANALLTGPIQKLPDPAWRDNEGTNTLASNGLEVAPNLALTAFDYFLLRLIGNNQMTPGRNLRGEKSHERALLNHFKVMGFDDVAIDESNLRAGINNHFLELNGKWRRNGREVMPSFEYRDRFNVAHAMALRRTAQSEEKPKAMPDHKRTIQYNLATLLTTDMPLRSIIDQVGNSLNPSLIVDTMILDLCEESKMKERLKEAMVEVLQNTKGNGRNDKDLVQLINMYNDGKLLAPISREIPPGTMRRLDSAVAQVWLGELLKPAKAVNESNEMLERARRFQSLESGWSREVAKRFVAEGYGSVNTYMTTRRTIPGDLGCKRLDLGAFAVRMMFGFTGQEYDIVDMEDKLIEMNRRIHTDGA